MELFLSIDVGTQSLKALVFNFKGQPVAKSQIVYKEPYFSNKPGYAEQNSSEYWNAIKLACRSLWSQDVSSSNVISVCITTQRASVVFLDENYKPVRPVILWLDQRVAKDIPSLGLYNLLFRLVGAYSSVKFFQKRAATNWVRENEPEVWKKTRYVGLLSAYLNFRLTGNFVDSVASQVGYVPFNYKKQQWESEGSWKYRAISLDKSMLPELKEPGDILGALTKDAADELGLQKGIPVISGASDKACEMIGSGIIEPNSACISYGTTATISVNTGKYFEPLRFFPSYPSAVKKFYDAEYQVFRGFWLVSWFKEHLAKWEKEKAETLGISAEEYLEKMAREVSPGCGGLIVQPYWSPVGKYPSPNAKGCIIGFNDAHKKEHIYRAILEGLVFALREGKEILESRGNLKINYIAIAGGGANSNLVAQITADIMNLPIIRPTVKEASALGAAVLSSVALGVYEDCRVAIKNMIRKESIFEPKRKNVEVYNLFYKNVFKRIYSKLDGVYKEINEILKNKK